MKQKLRGLFYVLLVLLFVIFGSRYYNKLVRTEKLATYPNQACVGIGVAQQRGVVLKHYSYEAKSSTGIMAKGAVGQHICFLGFTVTQASNSPDGSSSSSGYTLGANVIYFKNNDSASLFRDEAVSNEAVAWSRGNGVVSQVVTNVKEPYFDAFTIRGDTYISLSLPCPAGGIGAQMIADCNTNARVTTNVFADKVRGNLDKSPLF